MSELLHTEAILQDIDVIDVDWLYRYPIAGGSKSIDLKEAYTYKSYPSVIVAVLDAPLH